MNAVNRAKRMMDRAWAMIWVRLPISLFRPTINVNKENVIITLTSYPARIKHVHLTIRSLLKQSLDNTKILLVLSLEEYPSGLESLPTKVKRLLKRHNDRLEVHFTADNKKSYKKLLPALRLYPHSVLITVDDDVIYWRSFTQLLYSAHKENKMIVIGTRGTMMQNHNGALEPYHSWPQAPVNVPSSEVFLTGRGGILYPPNSLDERVFEWDKARDLCPNADDIWFKSMAVLRGTRSLVIETRGEYPSSGASQSLALWRGNVDRGENDTALLATFEHFSLPSLVWPT